MWVPVLLPRAAPQKPWGEFTVKAAEETSSWLEVVGKSPWLRFFSSKAMEVRGGALWMPPFHPAPRQ